MQSTGNQYDSSGLVGTDKAI